MSHVSRETQGINKIILNLKGYIHYLIDYVQVYSLHTSLVSLIIINPAN